MYCNSIASILTRLDYNLTQDHTAFLAVLYIVVITVNRTTVSYVIVLLDYYGDPVDITAIHTDVHQMLCGGIIVTSFFWVGKQNTLMLLTCVDIFLCSIVVRQFTKPSGHGSCMTESRTHTTETDFYSTA